MKQSLWITITPVILTISASAFAIDFEDTAFVKRVTPQIERVNTPHEECWNQAAPRQTNANTEHGITGALIGGIAGAVLGNQVGHGSGKTIATAAGAVTGAIFGDHIQNNTNAHTDNQTIQECHTVDHWEERSAGYQVVYEYAGHKATTVLPYDPGTTMKVHISVAPGEH